jgi:transmembrane sensor
MITVPEYIDDLIAKVLAGEADAEETAALDTWRKESLEHDAYYAETKKLFDAVENLRDVSSVNVEAAWQKVNSKVSEEATVLPLYKKRKVLRAAAAILFIAALGFIFKISRGEGEATTHYISATGTSVKERLPDGSSVVLNKNSEIGYTYTNKGRQVSLTGEAFFDVIHNEREPFVVTVGDLSIKDIGTSFNVKALPNSDTVIVKVESGEVALFSADGGQLALVKGETGIFLRESQTFLKRTAHASESTNSSVQHVLRFNETPLRDVIAQVNRQYSSDIRLSGAKVGNCRLSVEFNDEDIEMIVSIIAETMDLKIERSGKTIFLKGEPCR